MRMLSGLTVLVSAWLMSAIVALAHLGGGIA
jgi:hypothetical protein